MRLRHDAAGLPAGIEGILVGWYAGGTWEALVRFGDIDMVRVPADAIEPLPGGAVALVCVECGAVAQPDARGWMPALTIDGERGHFCPQCAEREVDGSGK